ncbi:hypothetical protein WA026_023009 [Henosepilachna vigintioctopunctata]|uniref:Uncharacterized protein n=1 Tax=Henosepilachna vigintioctopunctata TaxID=420089 RepID=A0AAW1VJD5_9CUCU
MKCLLKYIRKIHEHILCFSRKTTHYAGNARLDVKKIHLMFNEKYPDLAVKYKFYLQFFNENFWVHCFGIKNLKCIMKALDLTDSKGFERVYQYFPIRGHFRSTVAKLVQKTCLSTESYGKRVLEDEKKSFALSTHMSFQYDSDRKGTILAEEYIDGLIIILINKKITTSVSLPSTKTYDLKVPSIKRK